MSAAELATDWRSSAACRGRTTLFYATDEFSERLACAVCRGCVSREACLAEALAIEAHCEPYGVAGGYTAAQRRALC